VRAGLLMIGVFVTAAASAQEPALDCDAPQTTVDMVNCIGLEFELAERQLDETIAAEMEFLDAEGQALLKAAQLAWIEYREAECLRARDQARGGTLAAVLGGACLVDVTNHRTHTILGEPGLADSPGPEGSVYWSAAEPLLDTFLCDGPALARVGLAPGFDAAQGGPTLAVRLQIDHEYLDFAVGGDTQDAFCGTDVQLEIVQTVACPAIRMDDGMCDAIIVAWDPETFELGWTRR
jgi:uncharacterized protein YecT (DUF1311 family)